MDVQAVADAVVYMAGLPLDGQRPVHDGDGDQDAVHRAGLTGPRLPKAWADSLTGATNRSTMPGPLGSTPRPIKRGLNFVFPREGPGDGSIR